MSSLYSVQVCNRSRIHMLPIRSIYRAWIKDIKSCCGIPIMAINLCVRVEKWKQVGVGAPRKQNTLASLCQCIFFHSFLDETIRDANTGWTCASECVVSFVEHSLCIWVDEPKVATTHHSNDSLAQCVALFACSLASDVAKFCARSLRP